RHAERRRLLFAMREPSVRIRAEPMMNMKRDTARRPGDAHRRIEQHGRIEAAAVRDRNARIRRLVNERSAERIEHDAVGGRISGSIHDEWRSESARRVHREVRKAPRDAHAPDHAPGVVSLNLPYAISRSKRRWRKSLTLIP